MKSEKEIQLKKEAMERNIEGLYQNCAFHEAHEEQIRLDVLKWVLEEPVN